jgi:uncharacterized protein
MTVRAVLLESRLTRDCELVVRMSILTAGAEPLSDVELDRLAAFLEGIANERAMSVEELDGFFCALIAGPELVMPSEYLNEVWGGELPDENAFESDAHAEAVLGLIMRHWNAIIAEFEREQVYGPLYDEPDERGVPGRRWALGFMRGVAMRRRSWSSMLTDGNEGQLITIPLVAGEIDPAWPAAPLTEEQAKDLKITMAAGAARAYRRFRTERRAAARVQREEKTLRRVEPKVGRNEPCPCGSGKKYKQCCGRAGRLVH